MKRISALQFRTPHFQTKFPLVPSLPKKRVSIQLTTKEAGNLKKNNTRTQYHTNTAQKSATYCRFKEQQHQEHGRFDFIWCWALGYVTSDARRRCAYHMNGRGRAYPTPPSHVPVQAPRRDHIHICPSHTNAQREWWTYELAQPKNACIDEENPNARRCLELTKAAQGGKSGWLLLSSSGVLRCLRLAQREVFAPLGISHVVSGERADW